ncbi:MAG: hypothetical protein NC898_05255 [Candidatus Omnitrophica bacterium]|nr:hypothetical protein [Candidatus Omnitrophota bacterium]
MKFLTKIIPILVDALAEKFIKFIFDEPEPEPEPEPEFGVFQIIVMTLLGLNLIGIITFILLFIFI